MSFYLRVTSRTIHEPLQLYYLFATHRLFQVLHARRPAPNAHKGHQACFVLTPATEAYKGHLAQVGILRFKPVF